VGGGGKDLLFLRPKLVLRVHQPPLHRLHLRQLRLALARLVPQALPLRAPLVALLPQPPHLPWLLEMSRSALGADRGSQPCPCQQRRSGGLGLVCIRLTLESGNRSDLPHPPSPLLLPTAPFYSRVSGVATSSHKAARSSSQRAAAAACASAAPRSRWTCAATLTETCPVNTGGKTRRVRLVREEGRDVSG
jgi:hypothetical protein